MRIMARVVFYGIKRNYWFGDSLNIINIPVITVWQKGWFLMTLFQYPSIVSEKVCHLSSKFAFTTRIDFIQTNNSLLITYRFKLAYLQFSAYKNDFTHFDCMTVHINIKVLLTLSINVGSDFFSFFTKKKKAQYL